MEEPRASVHSTRLLVTLASLVVVVAGLRAAQSVLLPFLLAAFLAILGSPLVSWLARRRVPRALAVILVMLAFLGSLSVFASLLRNSGEDFGKAIEIYHEKFKEWSSASWLAGLRLDDSGQEAAEDGSEPPPESESVDGEEDRGSVLDSIDMGKALGWVSGMFSGLLSLFSNILLVLMIMLFLLLEASGLPAKIRVAVGPGADPDRYLRISADIQRYLGVKTITSLMTGFLAGILCWLAGIDSPVLWGILAFLLNYIPTLGSIAAAFPPVFLGLAESTGVTLVLIVGYVAINTIIGNAVEPILMGRRLGLSPLAVFLSLVFWGWLWGPVGMLLSVPLTMSVKILMENSDTFRPVSVLLGPAPGPGGGGG